MIQLPLRTGQLADFGPRAQNRRPYAIKRICFVLFAILFLAVPPAALAQTSDNPSGLPLPRFVSLRSEPINVRVGPGTRYDIAWVFIKPGLPVEIIQEFDTWRKIRDLDGQEGWVHQSLLSGQRVGYVAPWDDSAQVALRARDKSDARVRVWLSSRYLIRIEKCDGRYCSVSVNNSTGEGRSAYSGYVAQFEIWGVYPGEVFD